MTKNQILTAINERIPFVLKMPDGEEYAVADRFQIALGRTIVVVMGADDCPHILPLVTMTGISYRKAKR